MLLIRCPYCEEERPELEFRNAGEAHIARPANIAAISDDDFEKFFFIRSNPKGIIFERWRHVHGCARFFNAARDTVTDKFLAVYKAGEPKPDLEKFAASEPGGLGQPPPDQLNVKKSQARATRRGRTAAPFRIAGAGRPSPPRPRASPSTTNPSAASRAIRWPRRCSPTASI